MGRCITREIGLILVFGIMLYSKVAVSYPSFQRLVLRSHRRSTFVQSSTSSFRYLASTSKQSTSLTHKKSQEKSTLESEILQDLTNQQDVAPNSKNQTNTDANIANNLVNDPSLDSLKNASANVWSRSLLRSVRKGAGAVASTTGFLTSTAISIVNDRAQWTRSRPTVEAFQKFLTTSGIDLELSPSLNYHLLRNVVILGRIHRILNAKMDRRTLAKVTNKHQKIPSREEALRYMRYATAVYGSTMIAAAEMDARGIVDTRLSPLTKTRVSEHIHVPEDDIALFDLDFGGDGQHLRHFLAVDHIHKKVVLAIRGTFNLVEVVTDVAGFSRKLQLVRMTVKNWKSTRYREVFNSQPGLDQLPTERNQHCICRPLLWWRSA
jgi:hypothetical protein